MKVNIKGLVFTGFAAAILSANAMADPAAASAINSVTSKSYVDAKIASGTTADSLSESTTVAPNQTQVINALATKQPIQNTANYKVGQSGDWQPLNSAVAVANGGYLAKTDNADGSVTLNIDTTTQLTTTALDSNDDYALNANSGKLITEGAVAEAIAANGGSVNTGVLTVTQNGVTAGTFGANDSSDSSIGIAAPNWDQTSSSAADYIANKPTIVNTSASIDSAEATDTKVVPTTYAVHQYVDSVASDITSNINSSIELLEDVYQPISDVIGVGNGDGDWTPLAGTIDANADTSTAPTTLAVKTYVDAKVVNNVTDTSTDIAPSVGAVNSALATKEDASNKVTSLTSSSTDTQYPSAKAVYDMIGGNTIPAKDPSVCDSTTYNNAPCALVAEADGLHWRTMATATHDGGVLGDLTSGS